MSWNERVCSFAIIAGAQETAKYAHPLLLRLANHTHHILPITPPIPSNHTTPPITQCHGVGRWLSWIEHGVSDPGDTGTNPGHCYNI